MHYSGFANTGTGCKIITCFLKICSCLFQHMLDSHRVEDVTLNLSLVFAITHIDLEHLTLSILLHTLPNLLLSADKQIMLTDPRGYTLAKYCVLIITAAQTARSAQKGNEISNVKMEMLQ